MNNDAEVEGRPRPLSTGLWTLFSWLRRDGRSVSSDSVSSAGSDRTVASFAFLTPAHYHSSSAPLVLPPQGPPTDSYKKRVYDRNIRHQNDRDLTLHRKYGLYKSDGTSTYDASSLPPVRRINSESSNRWDRERRATSECYQRRLAHVPGKRRAPLPPVSAFAEVSSTLTRRSSRKRPAPQPPARQFDTNKENLKNEVTTIVLQMSSNAYSNKPKSRNNNETMGCKSEKYSKKDESPKDVKIKSEKSFLKQIFDGKKRNSSIDTSNVKILPSISELDKQAAEIIETFKLKALEPNSDIFKSTSSQNYNQAEPWFCINCLRKYNSSVVTCVYCLDNKKVSSSERVRDSRGAVPKASNSYTQTEKDLHILAPTNKIEEKQKLKEMLKEMKDSLPKRPKHELNNNQRTEIKSTEASNSFDKKSYSTESPTLRVGSTVYDEKKISSAVLPSTSTTVLNTPSDALSSKHRPHPVSAQTALVAQVISAYKKNNDQHFNLAAKFVNDNDRATHAPKVDIKKLDNLLHKETIDSFKDEKDLNTPLKISSLLNPVYIPKKTVFNKPQLRPESKTENLKSYEINSDKVNVLQSSAFAPSTAAVPVPSSSQVNVLPPTNGKIENKHKIYMEKFSKGEVSSPHKDKLPINIKEDKNGLESKPKENVSKLPVWSKERILSDNKETQDQHSRRRDLINQLEKSIAKGDERAAAEAATKLAQLRLSCSVLSFSSQILSVPSTSAGETVMIKGSIEPPTTNNDSHQTIIKEPIVIAASSGKDRSPPEVPKNKDFPTTDCLLVKVTTPLVTKSGPVSATPVQTTEVAIVQENQKSPNRNYNNMITIAILVEDREATRGPVHLRINRHALMRDLRREAEKSLGLATNLQRWIVGRTLCVNDNAPIVSLAGPEFSAPFYLCVVESETKVESSANITQNNNVGTSTDTKNLQNKAGDVYTELMQLEQQPLVLNTDDFECGVCIEKYPPGQGVVLRECVHIFCKDCLSDVVRHCEEPDIPCPAMGCRGILQEREIRALLPPQEYERWLARGLAVAESGTRNAFHCRTRDCQGWALCEPGVQRFPCPICKCSNCVPCQAIHNGETCDQHRAKLKESTSKDNNANGTDDGTRNLLNSLIRKGEALECPECKAIITKKWGCDWVKCSACKTEICWVTRGRRWGPGGKGDNSGGCRCGVDGKRCHPSCSYCH